MRLLISAGEASGEMYGAQLISALRRRVPELEAFGVGGERMRAAGCRRVVDAAEIAVVGLGEVVRHLPRIWTRFRRLLRAIDIKRPDAAVLIDFPDFNFRLGRELHRRGVPVIYYVSPQLWAWRPGRIELVRCYVRKMLVIFPFEEQWYRERGVDAEFVGHPLCESPPSSLSRDDLAASTHMNPSKPWIALLPGSRRREVEANLPPMLKAAALLGSQCDYLLPVASTLDWEWMDAQVARAGAGYSIGLSLTRDVRAALRHSRAAIVASGTATVEAALIGTPFVMVYRVSRLTWTLGRRLLKVPRFAMVNLIAGREVVPELVQSEFTAKNVAAQVQQILNDTAARERMLAGLAEVRARLCGGCSGQSASDRAAEAVLKAIAS